MVFCFKRTYLQADPVQNRPERGRDLFDNIRELSEVFRRMGYSLAGVNRLLSLSMNR